MIFMKTNKQFFSELMNSVNYINDGDRNYSDTLFVLEFFKVCEMKASLDGMKYNCSLMLESIVLLTVETFAISWREFLSRPELWDTPRATGFKHGIYHLFHCFGASCELEKAVQQGVNYSMSKNYPEMGYDSSEYSDELEVERLNLANLYDFEKINSVFRSIETIKQEHQYQEFNPEMWLKIGVERTEEKSFSIYLHLHKPVMRAGCQIKTLEELEKLHIDDLDEEMPESERFLMKEKLPFYLERARELTKGLYKKDFGETPKSYNDTVLLNMEHRQNNFK